MDEKLGESNGTSEQLIAYVKTVRTWFVVCDWC
jgi:hypothetical protein